jgi:hypothetical protein
MVRLEEQADLRRVAGGNVRPSVLRPHAGAEARRPNSPRGLRTTGRGWSLEAAERVLPRPGAGRIRAGSDDTPGGPSALAAGAEPT